MYGTRGVSTREHFIKYGKREETFEGRRGR